MAKIREVYFELDEMEVIAEALTCFSNSLEIDDPKADHVMEMSNVMDQFITTANALHAQKQERGDGADDTGLRSRSTEVCLSVY